MLWASQTGNAEEFAAAAAERLTAAGHRAALVGMDDTDPGALPGRRRSAADHQHLRRRRRTRQRLRLLGRRSPRPTRPRLDGRRYAVLAFGDSSLRRLLRPRPPPRPAPGRTGRACASRRAPTANRTTSPPPSAWLDQVLSRTEHRSGTGPTTGAGTRRPAPSRPPAPATTPARRQARTRHRPARSATGCSACPARPRRSGGSPSTPATARRRSTTRRATRSACGPSTAPTGGRVAGRDRPATRTPPCRSRASGDVPARRGPAPASRHHPDHPRPAALRRRTHRDDRELRKLLRPDNKGELAQWSWGRQAVDVVAEYPVRAERPGLGRTCSSGCSPACTPSRPARWSTRG